MGKRVVVAMSGGVDSSAAALLLKEQGYEIVGITMCFNLPDSQTRRPTCCGLEAIEDARRVCHILGARHYVLNFSKVLGEKVIEDFCQEYLKGRTPNPCIRCNQYVKFSALLKKAFSLGADFLSTGHYVRVERTQNSKLKTQNFLLKKARDKTKDQSYFLYRLNQSQLRHLLFPIGDYTKQEVRNLARENNLPVANKLGSQEICFLSGADYRKFLKMRIAAKINPGSIVDRQGNLLGEHKGIAFYTVGQREGLGIARGYPLYITKIEPKENRITVGRKKDVYGREFLIKRPHFISKPIKNKVVLKVKIRYNHKETKTEIIPFKKGLKVIFQKPQFAITPGQSAVFYDKDEVIGGGIIEIS